MSTPWAVAVVAVWILLAVVAVGLIALARQVGLLHLRVRPLGPGPVPEGPPIGSKPVIPDLLTLKARQARLLQDAQTTIVLFVSSTCGLCKPVLEGAARLRGVESGLVLALAVDGDEEGGLRYLRRHGFNDGLRSGDLAALDSGQRPYAVALADDGLVLASGAVNTLDQLEGLIDLARDRAIRGIPDLEHVPPQPQASGSPVGAVGLAED